jgi:hypothetical protein
LYEHILQNEEVREYFVDQHLFARLKQAQRDYLIGLTSGTYGEAYLNERLRIGRIHQRINLPVHLYMGAFTNYVEIIGKHLNAVPHPSPMIFLILLALTPTLRCLSWLSVTGYHRLLDVQIGNREFYQPNQVLNRLESRWRHQAWVVEFA